MASCGNAAADVIADIAANDGANEEALYTLLSQMRST
jgi:hypothetical protein